MRRNKRKYLDEIRRNSAYPVYRALLGVISGLCYIVFSGFTALVAVAVGISIIGMPNEVAQEWNGVLHQGSLGILVIVFGLGLSAFFYILIRFCKEGALIHVDSADATTEYNARAVKDTQDS